ncbi:MAG TPA: long-chain fatty acid--CoA ligase [Propionibacteriaceae bacterium]
MTETPVPTGRTGQQAVAERLAARAPSLGAMLTRQVKESGPREAYRYRDGDRWVSLSWDELQERVYRLAAGLLALGIQPEERVAIASSTRMEWILADLAISCAGAATTTVYPTTQHEDVAYIVGDSDSKVIFAEDELQVSKLLDHLERLPLLGRIVLLSGHVDHELVLDLVQFEAIGSDHLAANPDCVDEAIAKTGPDSLSTLIYTSGTTGRPKGVRLTHEAWTYTGVAIVELELLNRDDLQYLWLPLSHVFGKVLTAVQLQVGFATAVDGNIERIVENLGQVHPTWMAGAPRIFEKVRARVLLGAEGGVKGKIFNWAFAVGQKMVPYRLAGQRPSKLLAAQYAVADRLVFSKIKDRMGGRIRFFVSGSAALSREVQEWFYAAGLLIIEGYGLTETSAATFLNLPKAPRFGTVGPPVPGTEVSFAPDGEILVKGPAVMQGYHNLGEASEQAFVNGWFATGDIGELDDHGYLRITDRKKDLIKTSGGKYVAPQKVEGILKAASPYVSQIVVHGEGRKYVTALIALDPDSITAWGQTNGHDTTSYAEFVKSAAVRDLVAAHVAQANKQLERWETIKRFEILPSELSVDEGEVTPSLKIRRREVEKRYEDTLNSLYDSD